MDLISSNYDWQEYAKYIDVKDKNYDNLVYFHAFTGSYKNKSKLFGELKGLNIYAFDMPGHGNTKVNDIDLIDVEVYARIAIDFILTYDIKNIIMMGHSMGGGIIMLIANDPRIKNRIKKIILESPANPSTIKNFDIISKLIPSTFDEMKLIGSELFFDPIRFFSTEKNYQLFLEQEFKNLENRKFLKKIVSLQSQLKFAYLVNIGIMQNDKPTLVILGSHDNIISFNFSSNYVFNGKLNYQIKKIDEAKHVPIAEKFDECFKLIQEFLKW